MTEQGLEELKNEIRDLKSRGRAEMAQMIKEARDKGDLSENAEYDAAKEAQGMLEMKISQLEETLANARIMDKSQMDSSRITVLSKVKLHHKRMGREITYQLVAEKEADLKSGKISVTSPIGKGLLGASVGDQVVIDVPAGQLEFEVLEINL